MLLVSCLIPLDPLSSPEATVHNSRPSENYHLKCTERACSITFIYYSEMGVGWELTPLNSTKRGLKLVDKCPRLHVLWWDSSEPHFIWLPRGSPLGCSTGFPKQSKYLLMGILLDLLSCFTCPTYLFVFSSRQGLEGLLLQEHKLTCCHFQALCAQMVGNFYFYFILFISMSMWH